MLHLELDFSVNHITLEWDWGSCVQWHRCHQRESQGVVEVGRESQGVVEVGRESQGVVEVGRNWGG